MGMLPWIVHGARLTVQNLWAAPTVNPADMPIVFFPFSQYELDLVAGTILVGSAIAGGVVRILAARGMEHARAAFLTGVLIAQLIALVQTTTTVAHGLIYPEGTLGLMDDSVVYLGIMITLLMIMIALGAAVFVLVTRRSRSAYVIGSSIVAVALTAWVRGFVAPIAPASTTPHFVAFFVADWIPAVVVGAAIIWMGVVPARRAVAAVAAVAILWLGTAAIVAMAAAAGSRVLARFPSELIRYFGTVFASELGPQTLIPVAVAVGLAVIGLLIRWTISQLGAASDAHEPRVGAE
jgi:hypothetical protein